MPANRNEYTPLTWVNDQTKLNAYNLNHLETGVQLNNLLAKENANYIDEIYSALIDQLSLTYSASEHKLTLSIGNSDTSSEYYTERFNVSKSLTISGFYTTDETDVLLGGKVDKEYGKALSSNDFTDAFVTKLNNIAPNAQVNIIEGVKVNGTLLTVNNKQVNIETAQFLEKTSGTDKIYATNYEGAQVTLGYDSGANYGDVPLRSNTGHLLIPLEPTLGNHAVSKTYADGFAKSLDVSLNNSNYQITFTLKDKNNVALSNTTIDLPIESVVVNGSYDSTNEKIVLTLQNGNTIDIPVSDLIDGLISSVDLSSTLSDYVAKEEVVDNLTSTDDDLPLSANQGRVLKGLVDSKVSTTTFETALAGKEPVITVGNGLSRDSNTNTISTLIVASDVVINID